MAFLVTTRFSARSYDDPEPGVPSCQNESVFPCHHNSTASSIESILLYVVLLLVFGILFWKAGCCGSKKQKDDKTTDDESNLKEKEKQLSLPYPQPPSEIYEDTKGPGPNKSTSTLVDPYLISNNMDNSLISKDDSFKQTTIPESVKLKESVNYSSLVVLDPMPTAVYHYLPEDPNTIQLYSLPVDDASKKSMTTSNHLDPQPRPASPPPPVQTPTPPGHSEA